MTFSYVDKLTILAVVFICFAILGFFYKRKLRAKQKATEAKLCEDAKHFFVTVCHKRLTPFGTKEQVNKYLEFRIINQDFFVLQMESDGYGEKIKFKEFLLHALFKGERIIDSKTKKEYSYCGFENLLSEILADSFVYDFYIEHLWNEIHREKVG